MGKRRPYPYREYMPIVSPSSSESGRENKYNSALEVISMTKTKVGSADTSSDRVTIYKYQFFINSEDADYRELFMMCDGYLSYVDDGVVDEGFTLSGPVLEIDPERLIKGNWSLIMPSDIYPDIKKFYVGNINKTKVEEELTKTLKKEEWKQYVKRKHQEKTSLEEQVAAELVEFFDAISPTSSLGLKGGQTIGEIAVDDSGTAKYRLDFYVVFETSLNSFEITDMSEYFSATDDNLVKAFFELRQRVFDPKNKFRHLAGHPMISLITGIPPESSRVDIINSESSDFDKFAPVYYSDVLCALDYDRFPHVLSVQGKRSSSSVPVPISLTLPDDYGKQTVTIYNPDKITLGISATDETESGLLSLSINESDDSEIVLSIQSTKESGSGFVEIKDTDRSVVVKRIFVKVLPYKTYPIVFCNLTNYETAGDATPLYSSAFADINALVEKSNKILGKQANIFLYPDPSAVQTLEISGLDMSAIISYTDSTGAYSPAVRAILDKLARDQKHYVVHVWAVTSEYPTKEDIIKAIKAIVFTVFDGDVKDITAKERKKVEDAINAIRQEDWDYWKIFNHCDLNELLIMLLEIDPDLMQDFITKIDFTRVGGVAGVTLVGNYSDDPSKSYNFILMEPNSNEEIILVHEIIHMIALTKYDNPPLDGSGKPKSEIVLHHPDSDFVIGTPDEVIIDTSTNFDIVIYSDAVNANNVMEPILAQEFINKTPTEIEKMILLSYRQSKLLNAAL